MEILLVISQVLFIYLVIGLGVVFILLALDMIKIIETPGFFVGMILWPILLFAVIRKRIGK